MSFPFYLFFSFAHQIADIDVCAGACVRVHTHTHSKLQHEQLSYLRLSLLSLCLLWNSLSGLSGFLKLSKAERGLDFQISQCVSDQIKGILLG